MMLTGMDDCTVKSELDLYEHDGSPSMCPVLNTDVIQIATRTYAVSPPNEAFPAEPYEHVDEPAANGCDF
jgi:hypothetical protein